MSPEGSEKGLDFGAKNRKVFKFFYMKKMRIKQPNTLLITGTYFSGSIFKTRGNESLNDYGIAKLYSLPSRKAMTSGNLKTVPDQSKFFEFLNKRLNDNTQKYISARELFNSLYTAVLNNTNSVPLYGVIQNTGDEGGEFIYKKVGLNYRQSLQRH